MSGRLTTPALLDSTIRTLLPSGGALWSLLENLGVSILLPFLLGAVLGARFRVLVLVPAIGAVVAVALVAGLGGGNDLSAVAIDAASAVSCIQVGYFAGMLARGLLSGQAIQASLRRSA